MRVICRGAESIISLGEWDGRPAIFKERVIKGYRIRELDERLRRDRTSREVRLLRDARALGVLTPQILHVDEDKSLIVMEMVPGEMVKETFGRLGRDVSKSTDDVRYMGSRIGKSVGRLHDGGIVHGDLTTSNMVVDKNTGGIYFIDFGLGAHTRRVEDFGTDLKLLHEAIESTHIGILEPCWESIISGYEEEYKNAKEVIEKIEEIGGRGRYARRRV
jgi:bifunctional N6-L-threonylcarbamoyladenine synthase / protein kinase Bud32